MAAKCLSPSARIRTTTIPTPIRWRRYRADILEFNPNGSGGRVYAWGIRNPVGIAINPVTGELWASVNERDGLGDNLVPDYITHVEGRLLWLAVVLHRRRIRTRGSRASIRNCREGDRAGRAAAAPQRLARDDLL